MFTIVQKNRRKLQRTLVIGVLCLGGFLGATVIFYSTESAVLIESLESKTVNQKPVYNKIKFFPGWNRDIWMMNQSHDGLDAPPGKWDRLAIILDKNNKTAQYLQLPPGELEWKEDLIKNQTTFRVSCFMCHSNGPRAVRPNSEIYKLPFLDRTKIFLWNLRMKTYGQISEHSSHAKKDLTLQMPFRHRTEIDNDILQVKSCNKCHNEKLVFGRGFLRRQQAITIQFMITNKLMPPFGFELTSSDREKIDQFLLGF